jgi:hypothetical protein
LIVEIYQEGVGSFFFTFVRYKVGDGTKIRF